MKHESANVRTAADVRANVQPDTEVVGIDKAQFFDNELIKVVNELAERGLRVIVAGLDQDYTGKPWEPMPQLLAAGATGMYEARYCQCFVPQPTRGTS